MINFIVHIDHMLSTHQKIKYSIYKNLRRCKSFFLLIYIGICFFEKPFYCYSKTTLPFVHTQQCNDNIAFMNLPIIPNYIYIHSPIP